jgi:hypothetical protein
MMTVKELMNILGEHDPDTRVVIGYQPNYPLVAHIDSVVAPFEVLDQDKLEDLDEGVNAEIIKRDTVFILQGSQIGYTLEGLWG